MQVRDAAVVARGMKQPFAGYAIHARGVRGPGFERITACVALLATMVVGGVVLGTPRAGR